jgi:hypothetical protein
MSQKQSRQCGAGYRYRAYRKCHKKSSTQSVFLILPTQLLNFHSRIRLTLWREWSSQSVSTTPRLLICGFLFFLLGEQRVFSLKRDQNLSSPHLSLRIRSSSHNSHCTLYQLLHNTTEAIYNTTLSTTLSAPPPPAASPPSAYSLSQKQAKKKIRNSFCFFPLRMNVTRVRIYLMPFSLARMLRRTSSSSSNLPTLTLSHSITSTPLAGNPPSTRWHMMHSHRFKTWSMHMTLSESFLETRNIKSTWLIGLFRRRDIGTSDLKESGRL